MKEYNIVGVTCSNMRGWGRQALKGRWATAVLGSLLFSALISLPLLSFKFIFHSDTLERVSNLYTFIISGPLNLGYIAFIISIFRRKNTSPIEIFYGFERFLKAFALMAVMNVLIFLWSLLLIVPGIIASFRYSMAFYIFADNPEMGIMEIIGESKRMMQGNKLKLFLLQLSFLGWAVLVVLTLGIGYFWLMPYIVASTVGFYEVANGNLRPYYPNLTGQEDEDENTLYIP
ncbi:MAG TPA: DUF975 family protein [Anaerovoracaceae bacterium]|nr:DUF975 family protein [Anaerovoracaceae bacterium]